MLNICLKHEHILRGNAQGNNQKLKMYIFIIRRELMKNSNMMSLNIKNVNVVL